MALLSQRRSQLYANGNEVYDTADEWDASVTGGTDGFSHVIPAWSGDYEYFGYLNILGKWIIQRHQISTGQYLYVNGPNSYRAAWLLTIAGSTTGWTTLDNLFNTVP